MVCLCPMAAQQTLSSFRALRHMENVVKLGFQAKQEHHNVQQVVIAISHLRRGRSAGLPRRKISRMVNICQKAILPSIPAEAMKSDRPLHVQVYVSDVVVIGDTLEVVHINRHI